MDRYAMGDTQTSSETLDAFQDSNNQDDAHDWDLGVKKDNKKNDESKKDTSDEPDQDDQASQGEPNLESAMKDLNAQKTGTIISGDDFAEKSSISLLGSAVNSFEKVEGGFKVDLKWAGKMGARVKGIKNADGATFKINETTSPDNSKCLKITSTQATKGGAPLVFYIKGNLTSFDGIKWK